MLPENPARQLSTKKYNLTEEFSYESRPIRTSRRCNREGAFPIDGEAAMARGRRHSRRQCLMRVMAGGRRRRVLQQPCEKCGKPKRDFTEQIDRLTDMAFRVNQRKPVELDPTPCASMTTSPAQSLAIMKEEPPQPGILRYARPSTGSGQAAGADATQDEDRVSGRQAPIQVSIPSNRSKSGRIQAMRPVRKIQTGQQWNKSGHDEVAGEQSPSRGREA